MLFVIEVDESEVDNWESFDCVMVSGELDGFKFGYVGFFMEGYEKVFIVFVYGIFGFGEKVSFYIFFYDFYFCY